MEKRKKRQFKNWHKGRDALPFLYYTIRVICSTFMSKITIKYDPDIEFMEIVKDQKIMFFGNYWEFKNDPIYLHAILNHMGVETKLEECSI